MKTSNVLAPIFRFWNSLKTNTRYRWRYSENHVRIGAAVELHDVEIADYVNIAHHAQISGSVIGSRTSIGRYAKIRDALIGKYCSISWDVTIGAAGHPLGRPSTHAAWYRAQFGLVEEDTLLPKQEVIIGNDVWIGCGAVIMPGVEVADGAVIGAGAVVARDIPAYAIAAGVPAKLLRFRFEEDDRETLRTMKWWDWPDDELRANRAFFQSDLDWGNLAVEECE